MSEKLYDVFGNELDFTREDLDMIRADFYKGKATQTPIVNKEESWPERDELPTQDPIGDVDDPMDQHRLDALRYAAYMHPKLKKPEGKALPEDFVPTYIYKETSNWELPEGMIIPEGQTLDSEQYKDLYKVVSFEEPKCNCGTFAVHGKVPADAHRPYCALRKNESI